jgi:cytochrome c5
MFQFFIALLGVFLCLSAHAETHHPEAFLESIAGSKNEGTQIVEHFCASCHASKPLIPVGAPRMQHSKDWAPRMQQGLDSLLQHVHEGLRAMPPRGGCFECSDEQLMLAIKSLIPEEDQKELFRSKKMQN